MHQRTAVDIPTNSPLEGICAELQNDPRLLDGLSRKIGNEVVHIARCRSGCRPLCGAHHAPHRRRPVLREGLSVWFLVLLSVHHEAQGAGHPSEERLVSVRVSRMLQYSPRTRVLGSLNLGHWRGGGGTADVTTADPGWRRTWFGPLLVARTCQSKEFSSASKVTWLRSRQQWVWPTGILSCSFASVVTEPCTNSASMSPSALIVCLDVSHHQGLRGRLRSMRT